MLRKEYLQNMVQKLFGVRTPDYEYDEGLGEWKIVIKDGLANKCHFDSRKTMDGYASRFRILFEYALIIPGIVFELDNNMNRARFINNTTVFLQEQHVNIDALNFDMIDRGNLYLMIINNYIIPAIFSTGLGDFNFKKIPDENKKKNCENDDIDETISDAVSRINQEISRIQLTMYGYVVAQNGQIFVDSMFRSKGKKRNYAFRIGPFKLGQTIEVQFEPTHIVFHRELPFKSSDEECVDFFTTVIGCNGDFIEYKDDKKIVYCEGTIALKPNSKTLRVVNFETSIEYPLSTINISVPRIFTDYLYYVTYLDEESIRTRYPQVTTHEDLCQEMIKRIKGEPDLKHRFDCAKNEYYSSVSKYIDDVLRRIDLLIKHNYPSAVNMNELQARNILNCFPLDQDEVMVFLTRDGEFDENVAIQLYLGIQSAIIDFCDSLNRISQDLAEIQCKKLSKERCADHIMNLSDFIMSFGIDNAIRIQAEMVKKYPEKYTGEFVPGEIVKYLNPNLFMIIKKTVQHYYDCLNKMLSSKDSTP